MTKGTVWFGQWKTNVCTVRTFIKYSTNRKSVQGVRSVNAPSQCLIRARFNETDKRLDRNAVDCRTFTLELIKHAKAIQLDGHSGFTLFWVLPQRPPPSFNQRAYYRHFVHDHKKADIDFTTDTKKSEWKKRRKKYFKRVFKESISSVFSRLSWRFRVLTFTLNGAALTKLFA